MVLPSVPLDGPETGTKRRQDDTLQRGQCECTNPDPKRTDRSNGSQSHYPVLLIYVIDFALIEVEH
jgi:hypothetical protein